MNKGSARPQGLATPQDATATSGDVAGRPFDPFTATLDEAKAQPDAYAIHGAVSKAAAAHMLIERRAAIEAGDGFDVLQAVAQCALYQLVIPRWLGDLFLQRFRQVQQLHVASWEDPTAFGRPYPRVDLALARLRRMKRLELSVFFSETGTPRTKAGFAAAAKALGITPKQAENWTPKTRQNVKGHKPYKSARPALGSSASDPFGLTKKPR